MSGSQMKEKLTGIILAGGKNSRMGTNKAFLQLNGTRLIDRILSVYKNIFSDIIIVTNDPLSYIEFSNVTVVTDIYKGKGALGGIYTGLFFAKNHHAFVAACDMPFINENFIVYLTGKTSGCDVVIPATRDGLQPLHAIYSRNCLPHIKKMLLADQLKIDGLFKKVKPHLIAAEEIQPFNQDNRIFININTPGDLKKENNAT